MSPTEAKATCHFLQVGQGTSQIICLGGGRAIVVDGGPSAVVPLRCLERYVRSIVALIVSHNDADHQKGAYRILEEYWSVTEAIYLLVDRDIDRIGLYALADSLHAAGLVKVRRLEVNGEPHNLYSDSDTGVTLELLYPEFPDNENARRAHDSNRTCGVLTLNCGKKRLLFSGDATIPAWKRIRSRLGGPIVCDVMSVPHHAGAIWEAEDEQQICSDLNWLYTDVVRCDHAVISVGTHNPYNHPKRSVIGTLRSLRPSPTVLCTEITGRCCNLENVVTLGNPPRPRPSFATTAARGIACAGTVTVHLGAEEILIDGLTSHQEWVDHLNGQENAQPLCRRA